MARPPNTTQESILEAARAVFLERGISGTTAEVAKRARVSEGSIFNYFETKGDLFQAALQSQLEAPAWAHSLEARAGQGDLKANLYEIGMQAVDFFRTIAPLLMMLWSNQGGCGSRNALDGPDSPPMRVKKLLAGFFDAEVRLGRLQPHDPEILVRAFMGAIADFAFTEILHPKKPGEGSVTAEAFVRGHVDLFWFGASPERSDSPKSLHTRSPKKPGKKARIP
jgi:AcrR family transcriptional regulator